MPNIINEAQTLKKCITPKVIHCKKTANVANYGNIAY